MRERRQLEVYAGRRAMQRLERELEDHSDGAGSGRGSVDGRGGGPPAGAAPPGGGGGGGGGGAPPPDVAVTGSSP
jgi:hypothetical protein